MVTREFPGYHWIYWLGPVLGATIAAGFYRFIKHLVYEEANPCQDAAHKDEMCDHLRSNSMQKAMTENSGMSV